MGHKAYLASPIRLYNTGEHLALAEKESDYHAWVYPLIATALLLPLIVEYAEKDRNGTRAALADNKQACKSYEALGSTDQSDRRDPLPGRPRQAKTRPCAKQTRRGSVRNSGARTEAGGIDHDRTRRTAPGRGFGRTGIHPNSC